MTTSTRFAKLSRLRRDCRSCSTGFRFLRKGEILKIPKTAGVYAFCGKEGFLYIGKASNLRERIKNHFQQPSYLPASRLRSRRWQAGRDGLFLAQVSKIGYLETDSEIEALISEAKLIKKEQPKYNVVWRDDKNYFFVGITKEDFPRVFLTHQRKLKINYLGPFVEGSALKKTLRTLRKVFPYYTVKEHPKSPCPWCHLQLCPGPEPDKKEYQKNIKNLISILKGKRKLVLRKLKREMKEASLSQDYEKAAKIRDQAEALGRVMSHAKIFDLTESSLLKKPWLNYQVWKKIEKKLKEILKIKRAPVSRIEGYDISNIQGNLATGAMITFIDGKPDKNFYRKFKIKVSGKPNDTAMLREILERRFRHTEWPYPDLILIDGGKAQLNVAINLKSEILNLKSTSVMALAKRENKLYLENQKNPIRLNSLPNSLKFVILQLRDESHRFASSYHKKLRAKTLLK